MGLDAVLAEGSFLAGLRFAGKEPSSMAAIIALICLTVALLLSCRKPSKGEQQALLTASEDSEGVATEELLRALGAPEYPHEEGAMVPPMGLVLGNSPEESPFDNEICTGRFVSLHRATYDRALDKSGKYAFGKYFLGKKRLWEARVQFTLKRPVEQSDLFFGIELEQYVPMNAATKQTMSLIVRMLKRVVGDQVYHSTGDDPKVVSGALEDPVFVMPMWAFDQFIVTPTGEEPPKLTDPDIPSMGCKRFKRIREYQKEIAALKLVVGPTYTFCFWGISQFLDKLSWQVRMPLMSPLDFNLFAGAPPVHVVIYYLAKGEGESTEKTRHMPSRKNYLLNLAFWSSVCRPSRERVDTLLGDCTDALAAAQEPRGPVKGLSGTLIGRSTGRNSRSWFACCGGR
mmetsp:Transcript_20587/g.46427  ORF Transcript_20587/g.46427 Transcript_20587/m.46427 type:complete len:400 (+) Transcript_20587:108-1307(+)